jgi:hypothetical protein
MSRQGFFSLNLNLVCLDRSQPYPHPHLSLPLYLPIEQLFLQHLSAYCIHS